MAKEQREIASLTEAQRRKTASKGSKAPDQKDVRREWTSEDNRDIARQRRTAGRPTKRPGETDVTDRE